tara:strand:+ start:172 stop:552 length:381 start_codon:yes stop_codon:yes gene_type:complete
MCGGSGGMNQVMAAVTELSNPGMLDPYGTKNVNQFPGFPNGPLVDYRDPQKRKELDLSTGRISLQPSKAPASGAASASSKPKGRRQESSSAKGADRRGDLLGGGPKKAAVNMKNKEDLGKKTLLGA